MAIKLLTPVNNSVRRDFELADTTLTDPNETDALDSGEWMQINSSGKLARVSSDGEQVTNAYQVFTPKGSYDSQSLGKVCVIFSRDYEVETDMYDTSKTYTIGDVVGLSVVEVDSQDRLVFTNALSTDEDYAYGTVTLDPDNNNDLLRVHIQSPYSTAQAVS